jgi:hypothetical protein
MPDPINNCLIWNGAIDSLLSRDSSEILHVYVPKQTTYDENFSTYALLQLFRAARE